MHQFLPAESQEISCRIANCAQTALPSRPYLPWKEGKCLTWDVTVADTLAATYVSATSVKAGEAAAKLAANKRDKYEEITRTYLFCPIAIETMSPVKDEGRD